MRIKVLLDLHLVLLGIKRTLHLPSAIQTHCLSTQEKEKEPTPKKTKKTKKMFVDAG
jgi:hypothetical protein